MAVCEDCGRETTTGTSCTFTAFVIDGKVFERVFYGAEPSPFGASTRPRPCHDCGVLLGGYHHFGCDWERCPRCSGQLLSCGCGEEEILVISRVPEEAKFEDRPYGGEASSG